MARARARMTQEEFAEALSERLGRTIKRATIAQMESGERKHIDVSEAWAIVELAGVPIDLFRDDGDTANPGQLNWLDEALVGAAA